MDAIYSTIMNLNRDFEKLRQAREFEALCSRIRRLLTLRSASKNKAAMIKINKLRERLAVLCATRYDD